MRITESQLRRLIQKSLISEGFFDKVKKVFDPNFHKQVKQLATNVANKHGYQNFSDVPVMPSLSDSQPGKVQYGQGLTLEGFLKDLFVNRTDSSQNLVGAWYNYSLNTRDLNVWIYNIKAEVKPALIEYLGLTPSALQNPVVAPRFNELFELTCQQVSSSTKYFGEASGGPSSMMGSRIHPIMAFNKVKEMIKPDLVERFETLVPTILRPAF